MEIRGGAAELWSHQCDQSVVLEGGVNTGKTHGWGTFAIWFGEEFPGVRILILRKIRADLIESTLIKPWESTIIDKHLRLGIIKVQGGEKRTKYIHRNGTIFVPGGLDKSSRLMGGQWDLVIFVEATEASEGDYEDLLTRTSREAGKAPYSFIVLDVNPGPASHWINQKAEAGHLKRMLSRHEDNPILFDIAGYDSQGHASEFTPTAQGVKFLGKLDQLTGSRKERLKYHKWSTSEGLVWPEFQEAIHVLPRTVLRNLEFKKIIAGFDWGHNDPGSLTVWGIEARTNQCYLLFEVYRRRQSMNWWARRFGDVYDLCVTQFGRGLSDVVMSHEAPDRVTLANDFMQESGRPQVCRSYRAKAGSISRRNETVRWFWRPGAAVEFEVVPDHSAPMAYVLRDSLIFPATDEDELGYRPVGLVQEIPGYIWAKTPDGKRSKEEPDSGCPNHACDSGGMALQACFEIIRHNMHKTVEIEPMRGTIEWSTREEFRLLEG